MLFVIVHKYLRIVYVRVAFANYKVQPKTHLGILQKCVIIYVYKPVDS